MHRYDCNITGALEREHPCRDIVGGTTRLAGSRINHTPGRSRCAAHDSGTPLDFVATEPMITRWSS